MTRESPVLRQAIIRVKPAYFSWSQEEQERYRVALPEEDDFRINQHLFRKLFNITIQTDEQLTAAWENLSHPELDIINEHRLPLTGIGDNCFWLNEWFAEEKSLLSFDTLHDYDAEDHAYQQQANKKQSPDYVVQPYHGSLYYRWARLFMDETFTYATLSCAGYYVNSQAESLGQDYLHELIPYERVRGRHHGERDDGKYRWDLRINAYGREAEQEELQERFWKYAMARAAELAADWDQRGLKGAYLVEREDRFAEGPQQDFIFTDREALKAIRLRHFMADFRAIEQDASYLEREIETEKQRMRDYLDEQMDDMKRNFDPSVRKLKPRRKIFLSPRAKKDMEGLDSS